MNNRWQLAVYTEDDETTVPLAKYLSMRYEGRANWKPSLEDSVIILETQGREWLASKWNLGNIGIMVLQFEAARKRLCGGDFALIRSAVDDYSHVPYLMLEPINEREVLISLFFIDDLHMRLLYPVSGRPAVAAKLYDYVAVNKSQLLGPIEPGRVAYSFRRLCFPFVTLILSLKREAELVRQLYEELGEPMPRFGARPSHRR